MRPPRPATPSPRQSRNRRNQYRRSDGLPPHEEPGAMGTLTGFMEYASVEEGHEPVPRHLKSYKEFVIGLKEDEAKVQTARCMDCGTPFCIGGCQVNNIIPDFNDTVSQSDLKGVF